MVTFEDAHFIGGHPVLDLTNTVFNRAHPAEDNELLKTPADVRAWCAGAGLRELAANVADVHTVREHAWAVFNAIARGEPVPAEPFGALLERAGAGLRADPGSLPATLALLAVEARFTLPPDRVRACGRCGWLFLDSSRGGRRRWCSMTTCGNREKASRHRQVTASGA